MSDNVHGTAARQAREMTAAAQRMREEGVRAQMEKWGIEREPAEHIYDLERRVKELEG